MRTGRHGELGRGLVVVLALAGLLVAGFGKAQGAELAPVGFSGGLLAEDTVLSSAGGPYVISEDIVVPAGVTLTVEPGATLRFNAGRALQVDEGRLVAVGTPAQPILFTRAGIDPWGAIVFQNCAASSQMAHATVEYAGQAAADPYWQGVIGYQACLTMTQVTLRHATHMGLTLEHSRAQVVDSVIHDVGQDGIHVVDGEVLLRGNEVYGTYEGIELEYTVTPPATLVDNHVHHVVDDCVDLDASLARVEGNRIHHCGGKGISIAYGSAITVVNNVIYSATEGIAVQDGSTAQVVNNTVVGNQVGLGLHKHYLSGGGVATVLNTIIWGNERSVELRDGSTLHATYSNIEGGWPGQGNVDIDPSFYAPVDDDYRLLANSPCADTAAAAGAPAEDIRGVARPSGPGYDQGAYEYSTQVDMSGSVVINELQYHPRSDDHGEEYVELYNFGGVPLDLSGWRFSDGVQYTFPAGTTISPGGYVVVANDPATVGAVYGISGVLGPFTSGRLANGGERLALEDGLGSVVDQFTYDDHLPWPAAADGDGPSMELINPDFDNDRPCSWASSTGLGTPGARNSAYSDANLPPCVTDVHHTPLMPTSGQAVSVSALVDDNGLVQGVTLFFRSQGETAYSSVAMVDDGTGGDTVAGDGRYTAVIPPQGDGLIVEFYVVAVDDLAAARTVPDGAPGDTSGETGLPITVSFLYLVEDTSPTGSLPIYRLLVTEQNQTELATRNLYTNDLLDATFVYGSEAYYNVGLRYRGESSRHLFPKPYRIKFPDAHEFEDRERINLVSDELGREALAHDLFQRAGLLAADTRFVTLYINGSKEGDYLDVEQVDNDFLEAHLPGNDHGNLYRAYDGGNLVYRGSQPESYAPYYLKKNNEDADDYADVIDLTDALTNSPDGSFRAAAEARADMRQWIRWFAVQAILDNHEGALWIGQGDDYFLYHRPSDDRFVLISWDHDYTFAYADHSIWEPNWLASDVVQRILNYPDYRRWYYQEIHSLAASEFSTVEMNPRIDSLPDVVSASQKQALKQYVAERGPAVNNQIPGNRLSIITNGGEDFTTTGALVELKGECSPLRDVTVNGSPEGVSYTSDLTWRYQGVLWDVDNTFTVTDGLDTETITVHWDSFHGGVLTGDTMVATSPYPYAIAERIVVPAGVTLVIEPGVTLKFFTDRYLRVNEGGRLVAEGTATQPILFTRQSDNCWGGILFDQTQEDNRIQHAVIEYTHEGLSNPRLHGVSVYGGKLTLSDSVVRHTDDSVAFQSFPWMGRDPTVTLLRNEFYDVEGDVVHVTGGYAYLQGNHIHDAYQGTYPLEGIEVSHMDVLTPAILLDNHVHHVSDDCIDLNHSSAQMERNRVHHCGDKGISIGHPSSTTLVNNLIYACQGHDGDIYSGTGIAVKDGATATIVNNTVADSRHGIYVYEGHDGEGGGTASVANTILWGHSRSALEVDDLSDVTVTYSTLSGGWPGLGNSDQDPLFRNAPAGVYRLLEESPCVDTATPEYGPAEDIHGVYRPHGEGYDRGAHEFFEYFSTYLPLTTRHSGPD